MEEGGFVRDVVFGDTVVVHRGGRTTAYCAFYYGLWTSIPPGTIIANLVLPAPVEAGYPPIPYIVCLCVGGLILAALSLLAAFVVNRHSDGRVAIAVRTGAFLVQIVSAAMFGGLVMAFTHHVSTGFRQIETGL
ncbi:MAG TPA: hypothetical protein VEB20_11060 [Azospirillaceae bacterium]|nr:hypothetical protein [Azospirillaceae bacterium]